ncbi:transposase [Paenibacillus sp. J2TS4]|uniref:transposase n=1 Tax=Paenibacillus sp. J2TS4 TaxID=2807194 RepID=UPI001BD0FFAB|nr:transposase [Paenibacillus sp. J2TS4]
MALLGSNISDVRLAENFSSGLQGKSGRSTNSSLHRKSDATFSSKLHRKLDWSSGLDSHRKQDWNTGISKVLHLHSDVKLNFELNGIFKWNEQSLRLEEKAFRNRFKTEEDCAQFIYQAKWPNGFSCPRCEHKQAYVIRSRRLPLYECRSCRHQTSLIAGTVMEGSRTSLCKWFLAFHLVSHADRGTNAVQLSSLLHVTYKTAWLILHKIRQALAQADNRRPLTGMIKGGMAFYRPFHNATSLLDLYPEQMPVFVAASLGKGTEPYQIKIKTIHPQNIQHGSILPAACQQFTEQHISSDAEEVKIETRLFRHHRIPSLRKYVRKARSWINRTFNGIGPKYLQYYLDEFCFRLNLQLQNRPIFDPLANVLCGPL